MALSGIEVREQAEQHTAVVRRQVSMQEMGRIPEWLGQTYEAVQRAGVEPSGMPFVRYNRMDADSGDIEVGWPVAEPFAADGDVQPGTLPPGPAAVGTYLGPYEGIGGAYEAMEAWCAEHGHEVTGAPWECYLTDPNAEPDPAKWRTDIYFPVRA